MASYTNLFLCALFLACIAPGNAFQDIVPSSRQVQRLNVQLDLREVQHLAELQHFWTWAQNGRRAMEAWYPWIMQELRPQRYTKPHTVLVEILNKNDGIAWASGNKILVASGFLKKTQANDVGVVIHELVHVIQWNTNRGLSGNPKPSWATEGVADYIRWPYYERRNIRRFPAPNAPDGYTRSYQVTAGFFLWIEKHRKRGFVTRLHNEISYSDDIFRVVVGKPVRALWADYLQWRERQ